MAQRATGPLRLGENRTTMRTIQSLLLAASPLVLLGCAALSDVTPIGADTFMATAHSNDVNARVDEQKAQVMRSAAEFCRRRGARVEVIRLDAAAPPPGRPPTAELDFRCQPG
jgi:hypothetical protein